MNQAITDPVVTAGGPPAAGGTASLSDRVKGLRLDNQLGGAKGGGSSWLPWVLCLLMAVTWASFAIRAYTSGGLKGFMGGSPAHDASSHGSEGTRPDKPAKSTGPAAEPGEMVLHVKGYMVAAHQIQVSPIEVSGRIEKLFFEEGMSFKKGAVLAELDRTSYQADFDEAEGYLASAKAKLEEMTAAWPLEINQAAAQLKDAEALRDQFERDYNRYEDIRRKNGGVNDKEFEQAKFGFFSQSARVSQMQAGLKMMESPRKQKIEGAKADVRQAQARRDRAKWRLDNCTIVAPVNGIILTKRAEIGNLVNALAMNANLNGGICDMADLTDLEVDLEIQERDISKVFIGQDCDLQSDAYPNRRYQARVARIMPVANRSLAIIPIRVGVRVPRKEEGIYLKPQMGANINFYNRKAPPEPAEPPEPTITE